MTALGDWLGPVDRCPLGERCEACGSARELDVATYDTQVGVFCATACDRCLDQGKAPPVRGWAQACERVAAYCEHLGVDLDQIGRHPPPRTRPGGARMIDLTAVIEQDLDPPEPGARSELDLEDAAALAAEVRAARAAVVDAAPLAGQPHLDGTDAAEHLAARVAAYDRATGPDLPPAVPS
jgi:hypothetical protein